MNSFKVEWSSIEISGKGAFVFKEKLKVLKGRLKWWYKEISGWLDLKVDLRVSDLNELDRILVESDGTICK